MSDIVTFLRTQIASDRRAAQVAGWSCSSPWSMDESSAGDSKRTVNDAGDRNIFDAGYCDTFPNTDSAVAWHITTFDPAHIITECDAKLAIIELLKDKDYVEQVDTYISAWHGDPSMGYVLKSEGRAILEALAAVYSDRPGYDQSWAVAA